MATHPTAESVLIMDAKEAAEGSPGEDKQKGDAAPTPASSLPSSKSCKEPELRRLSVAPALRRRSSSTLSSIPDLDLAELSLLDALTQAATDVLGSIPAQRCIVYIYDKAANLLRPQVVVDCHDKDPEEAPSQPADKPTGASSEVLPPASEQADEMNKSNSAVGFRNEDVATSPVVSFPPVVGMVSSCFLTRRCLRMQEPHPHRSFHREYDVPKDMQVDSILCAPVILYHRATAVIQLLNRLDAIGDRIPFEELERAVTPQDVKNVASSEVRMRRLNTVKAIVKTGFSIKDEQKLLHFTTHIAQTTEINTNKRANVRNQAKIREGKAKQALELLNALNGTIVARVDSTKKLLPSNVAEQRGRSIYMRRSTVIRLPSQKGVLTDMLSALVVLMRLQAIFRGRRQRRADRFTDELEKFKRQRERLKTLIVMQRVVRTPEEDKPRVHEKPPSSRPKEGSCRSNARVEEPTKTPPSPPRSLASTPASPCPPSVTQPPVTPPPRPTIQSSRSQRRRKSAAKIQKVFRRYRQRRRAIPAPHLVKPFEVPKEITSAVKVQSFVRGNLVRKKLRQAQLSPRGPQIICLRVVSRSDEVTSNQNSCESHHSVKSQTCIYAMPERPGKALPVHRRIPTSCHNQEERLDEYRPQNSTQNVAVESRRLLPLPKGDDTLRLQKLPASRSRPRWDRLVSSVVWDASQYPGHEPAPPGVEFVKRNRPSGRRSDAQSDKVNSFRPTSIASVSRSQTGDDAATKPSLRLPVLASQLQQRDVANDSLLCCLLPAQTKRLTGGFAPAAAFNPRTQMGSKASRAPKAAAVQSADAATA